MATNFVPSSYGKHLRLFRAIMKIYLTDKKIYDVINLTRWKNQINAIALVKKQQFLLLGPNLKNYFDHEVTFLIDFN